jgi:hypothetical protein
MLVQVADIGIAPQKPEQLINDRLHVQLLRCEERESGTVVAQVESRLCAKDGQRSSARAVDAVATVFEHKPE